MALSKLRRLGAMLAALTLGECSISLSSFAQNQTPNLEPRVGQEEDIREAAFLFLFEVGTGPDPDYSLYCLSVDSDGPRALHDPSDALLERFPRMHRTIRKASECEVLKKPKDFFSAVRDKKSGKSAWMISVGSIEWINDHEVRVGGTRYCGGLCMWSTVLKATLKDGKWKVAIAPDAPLFVS